MADFTTEQAAKLLRSKMGDAASPIIAEMVKMGRELQTAVGPRGEMPRPPMGEKTHGGADAADIYSPFDMTPIGGFNPRTVSMDTMLEMMKDGLVTFILDVRAMPIIGIFRNPPGDEWDVDCPTDKEVEEVVRKALQRIMLRLVLESQTARAFGVLCAEKVFMPIRYGELGVEEKNLGKPVEETKWAWVYEKIKGNSPDTIDEIRRNPRNDRFEGYIQEFQGRQIPVKADKAFVLTHRKLFGDLKGQALLERMYVPWWWLQFVWRAILRYLDRMGTPVAVCRAPGRESYTDRTGQEVKALDMALDIALSLGKSNAASIPSDNFLPEEGGGPKWELMYLAAPEQAGQMLDAKNDLVDWLMRSADIPEKSVGISEDTGAYAAWRVPFDIFMSTCELDLTEFVQHVNDYLVIPLLLYNFGEEAAHKGYCKVTTKGLSGAEIQQALDMAKQAIQSGHPHAKALDVLALFEQAGLPINEQVAEILKERAVEDAKRPPPPFPGQQGPPKGGEPERGPRSPDQAPGASEEGQDREGEPEEERQAGEVPSGMSLSTDDVLTMFAMRDLRDKGYITLAAATADEARKKAQKLLDIGIPGDARFHLLPKGADGDPFVLVGTKDSGWYAGNPENPHIPGSQGGKVKKAKGGTGEANVIKRPSNVQAVVDTFGPMQDAKQLIASEQQGVTEYMGVSPDTPISILTHEEMNALEDRPLQCMLGFMDTSNNTIKIREETYPGTVAHELIHAAGIRTPRVGHGFSEGLTEAITEAIVPNAMRTYPNFVKGFMTRVLPLTGMSLQQFAHAFVSRRNWNSALFVGQLIWQRYGQHFSNTKDWSSDKRDFDLIMGHAITQAITPGYDSYISYLIDEVGVLK